MVRLGPVVVSLEKKTLKPDAIFNVYLPIYLIYIYILCDVHNRRSESMRVLWTCWKRLAKLKPTDLRNFVE